MAGSLGSLQVAGPCELRFGAGREHLLPGVKECPRALVAAVSALSPSRSHLKVRGRPCPRHWPLGPCRGAAAPVCPAWEPRGHWPASEARLAPRGWWSTPSGLGRGALPESFRSRVCGGQLSRCLCPSGARAAAGVPWRVLRGHSTVLRQELGCTVMAGSVGPLAHPPSRQELLEVQRPWRAWAGDHPELAPRTSSRPRCPEPGPSCRF